jgi:hypothetical protein
MPNHTQTRNTGQSAADVKPERRREGLQVQRVDVLDLQQAIVANQVVLITYTNEPGSGIPFSALND